MKLQLKSIKYMSSLSEETPAYSATVCVDGKPICDVSNHGHGGCDMEYRNKRAPENYQEIMKKVRDYFKSLPKIKTDIEVKGKIFEYDQSLEGWCHEELYKHLHLKDLRRKMSKKLLFTETETDNAIYQMNLTQKGKKWPVDIVFNHVKKQHPNSRCLNLMPEQEALRLYTGK